MIINFKKEDYKKLEKLIDTKEVNMAVASMFMDYNTYIEVVNPKKMEQSKDPEYTYLQTFLDFFNIDRRVKENKEIIEKSIKPAISKVDPNIIRQDPYYQQINIDSVQDGEYFLGNIQYYPYQSFAYDDLEVVKDVVERIKSIDIPALISITDFEEHMVERKYSIFPQLISTEKPSNPAK